ncbi:TcmI family type II polyketide cyclase [Actinacidiphila oryziradicis]|uniref:TcmI family type II polyketide cyclase n=1 Tax=Actinacidiphila oryziradicis TaxID=2571141 RepID=A0A4U0SS73_9ACTN|nr:TcmI family type II polyketide cyclase [Actinacidiphila oryziradicis]TKA11211.1 TcmI family type II polyketide cyclase [Actinacidiphila oryziradicis]
MSDRALIVARMNPENAPNIAGLFADSDTGELPGLLGVRRRHLFAYRDLYFHYVEFEGDHRSALRAAAGREDFVDLSRKLRPYVDPYDPDAWTSPADALAAEFYCWTPDGGVRR